jgi:hypothetical protein
MKQADHPSVLFGPGSDAHLNACLNYAADNWSTYAEGYKEGADILAAQLLHGEATLDTVVYPLVFLYRQYIELRLKHLARDASRLMDQPFALLHTHRIETLWKKTRQLLEEADKAMGAKPDLGDLERVEMILLQLDASDPQSFAFRYPEDKEQRKVLPDLRYINVRALIEQMDEVTGLLEGADMTIGIWLDWRNDARTSL